MFTPRCVCPAPLRGQRTVVSALLKSLQAALLLLITVAPRAGATVNYLGPNNGDWDTAANWQGSAIPTGADDARNTTANGIIHSQAIADAVNSFLGQGPLVLSGGSITVGATFEVDNTFTLNGGTLIGGTLNRGSGGQGLTVDINGGTLNGGTLADNLQADITNGGTLSGMGLVFGTGVNVNINAGATFTADAATLFAAGDNINIAGGATFKVTGNQTLDNFNMVGLSDALNAPANVVGDGANNVTFNSLLNVYGPNLNINNMASLTNSTLLDSTTLAGTWTISPTLFTNNATVRAEQGGTMNISAATFTNSATGTADVHSSGIMNISSGTVNNQGVIYADVGGSISAFNGTLANTGTIHSGSQGMISIGESTWSNNASAVINADASGALVKLGGIFTIAPGTTISATGGGEIRQYGTLDLGNSGGAVFNAAVVGNYQLNNGTILNGSIQNSDQLQVAAASNATLDGVTIDKGLVLTNGDYYTIQNAFNYGSGNTFKLDNGSSLIFHGNRSLDNATLDFGVSSLRNNVIGDLSNTLTLPATLTLQGNNAAFYNFHSIVNNASVTSQGGLGAQWNFSDTDFTNNTALAAKNSASLNVFDGTVSGQHTFTNNGSATATGGTFGFSISTMVNNGAISGSQTSTVSIFSGGASAPVAPTFTNNGTVSVDTASALQISPVNVNNTAAGIIKADGVGTSLGIFNGTIINDGTIQATNGAGLTYTNESDTSGAGSVSVTGGGNLAYNNSLVTSNETISVNGGGLILDKSVLTANQPLSLANGDLSLRNGSVLTLTQAATSVVPVNLYLQNGSLTNGSPGSTINITTAIHADDSKGNAINNTSGGTFTVSAPSVDLTNGGGTNKPGVLNLTNTDLTASSFDFSHGGTLAAHGAVNVTTANLAYGATVPAMLQIGGGPGTLTVHGSVTQGAQGTLALDVMGPNLGSGYSRLTATGTESLDGTLQIAFSGPVQVGASFDILHADGGVSGTFATLTGTPGWGYSVSYLPNDVMLNVNSVPAPTPGPESIVVMAGGLIGVALRIPRRKARVA